MNVADKVPSYPEWVAGMAAAGIMPDLSLRRYNKEAKQCYQAGLRPPKFAKRGTLNESDYFPPSYSLGLNPQAVEQIFETHQRVTRKIDVLGEIRTT